MRAKRTATRFERATLGNRRDYNRTPTPHSTSNGVFRLHRAPERGIEQRRCYTSVHHTERVVMALCRQHSESNLALLDRLDIKPQQPRERRRSGSAIRASPWFRSRIDRRRQGHFRNDPRGVPLQPVRSDARRRGLIVVRFCARVCSTDNAAAR